MGPWLHHPVNESRRAAELERPFATFFPQVFTYHTHHTRGYQRLKSGSWAHLYTESFLRRVIPAFGRYGGDFDSEPTRWLVAQVARAVHVLAFAGTPCGML